MSSYVAGIYLLPQINKPRKLNNFVSNEQAPQKVISFRMWHRSERVVFDLLNGAFQTSVTTQSKTRRHISEDLILQEHHSANLKSLKEYITWHKKYL
jgi:hypothetical protein